MDEEQRRLVYRYLTARAGFRGSEWPPLATLADQMKNGVRVLIGGVVIDRTTKQPIVGDEQDHAFFAAIVNGDEEATGISPRDLEQTRKFVLHNEGSLPPPFGRETSGVMGHEGAEPISEISPGKLLPSDLETRKAAEGARWGTSHEATLIAS